MYLPILKECEQRRLSRSNSDWPARRLICTTPLMTSAQSKTSDFQWRVRPGLLLFFVSVLSLAVAGKTGLELCLQTAPMATHAILLVAMIATAFGWFVLCRDLGTFRSWHKWTALAGTALLTLSIFAYASYALIPLKFILPFGFAYAIARFFWHWQSMIVIPGLGWIVPLFGRGWARIAFVVAGTLMLFVWAALH